MPVADNSEDDGMDASSTVDLDYMLVNENSVSFGQNRWVVGLYYVFPVYIFFLHLPVEDNVKISVGKQKYF